MTTLRIKRITTELLDIPIKRPHQFSTEKVAVKSFVLIRMELSNGVVGIGEGTISQPTEGESSHESRPVFRRNRAYYYHGP